MRLAVLVRDRGRDFVRVAIEKLLEAEHVLYALERGRRAPIGGRLFGGRGGGVDLPGRRGGAGGRRPRPGVAPKPAAAFVAAVMAAFTSPTVESGRLAVRSPVAGL